MPFTKMSFKEKASDFFNKWKFVALGVLVSFVLFLVAILLLAGVFDADDITEEEKRTIESKEVWITGIVGIVGMLLSTLYGLRIKKNASKQAVQTVQTEGISEVATVIGNQARQKGTGQATGTVSYPIKPDAPFQEQFVEQLQERSKERWPTVNPAPSLSGTVGVLGMRGGF